MRDATSSNRDVYTSIKFQSTRPMRDATGTRFTLLGQRIISIHASHAGRDLHRRGWSIYNSNFNPRVPCGTRLVLNRCYSLQYLFQSTRPMRDATRKRYFGGLLSEISIHASHAGRDLGHLLLPRFFVLFQSTRPMRDATSTDSKRCSNL